MQVVPFSQRKSVILREKKKENLLSIKYSALLGKSGNREHHWDKRWMSSTKCELRNSVHPA